MDVHKNGVYATVMSYGGEVVDRRKLPNDEVVAFLDRYPIDKVAMESSTSIVPIYRALREKGYTILVSHPKKTRLIAESRIKTDKVDSWAVTELARLNALPLSYVPPDDIAALREKVRRRAFLVRMRSKLKVKVRAQLTINGIQPPSDHGLFTAKRLEWLHSLQLDSVESYLPVISSLDVQVGKLSKDLQAMAPQDEDDSDNRDVCVPFAPHSFVDSREDESASSLPMRSEKEDEACHQTEKAKSQHSIERPRSSCNSTHDSFAIHVHLNIDECFPLILFHSRQVISSVFHFRFSARTCR